MSAATPPSTGGPPAEGDAGVLAIDCVLVTEILTGFVREEVGKVGFRRGVVGLSGGVDSALTLAIACRALGAENVVPIVMPYRTSSPASERDARLVAARLGAAPLVIDISAQVDAYFERLPEADRARRGNKMARERMSILYDISSARDALVIGTSNKTELLLGYSTIHGDSAYALNPIGDLYKTQVYALAGHLGLPEEVLAKPRPPTSGRGSLTRRSWASAMPWWTACSSTWSTRGAAVTSCCGWASTADSSTRWPGGSATASSSGAPRSSPSSRSAPSTATSATPATGGDEGCGAMRAPREAGRGRGGSPWSRPRSATSRT